MYKWNLENLGLFFFVQGQMTLIQTITLDQALKNYVRFMGIDMMEWDFKSLRSTYSRLQKEFYKDSSNCDEDTKKDK